MSDLDELRWVRIFTPDHIPRYLIEQLKDREYSTDDFYTYHHINCLTPEQKLNPFLHLYVLVDPDNIVKGMLWFDVDPLSKDILIQTYSVNKEYWNRGMAVKKLSDHIKEIRRNAGLKKIFWVTSYPKHSERNGFKRSRHVLMEYNEEEHGENLHEGKNGAHRECESADTTAELVSVECAGAADA